METARTITLRDPLQVLVDHADPVEDRHNAVSEFVDIAYELLAYAGVERVYLI